MMPSQIDSQDSGLENREVVRIRGDDDDIGVRPLGLAN